MPLLAELKENEYRIRPEPAAKRLRVLVVDDSREVAECLALLLRHLGHVAEACCSGRDGLARLDEFRPQVVLLDISMPVEDGFEICRQIRRRPGYKEVPVIACSAMDRWLVEEQSNGCRFAAYLVKPVSAAQIEAAIQATKRQQAG